LSIAARVRDDVGAGVPPDDMAGHDMTEPELKPLEIGLEGEPRRRNRMDRFIDGIELLAAFFVGIVAADIFISVLLRYFFSVQIPDSYDFGRLLLGILIFWGIAATSYRGTHITVDLLYANVGPKLQRFIDVFATLVLLFVVSVQTWTLFDKVVSTRADNVLTFDLRLPTWPFFLVAWLGDVSAVLLIAVRTYRLIFQPELMGGQYQIKPVE
jgi:TRAP-type transport system small permease protein